MRTKAGCQSGAVFLDFAGPPHIGDWCCSGCPDEIVTGRNKRRHECRRGTQSAYATNPGERFTCVNPVWE